MPHAVFRFPGRRYHATPWNSHVNEGLVEWPPSPWRICRALIATGFTKLGWRESGVPEAARSLTQELASALPIYRLPSAATAHTRHYMPIAKGKTTKVFDTFAHVGDQALGISWPVTLDASQEALLESLLTHMGYLGRAESWVSAERVREEELPDHPAVAASDHDSAPPPGWESTTLMAPVPEPEYASWREEALADALEAAGTGLTAAKRRQIEGRYPRDLWDCLTRRTGELQKHGWSQPPGSRIVRYLRPQGSLAASAPRLPSRQRARPPVECALLALSSNTTRGDTLPLMKRALPQAEILHRTLVGLDARISGEPCSELTGRDESGKPLSGHRHAHYLPLDLDGDGRLDHVLIHAPMGLGAASQRALARLSRTWAKGDQREVFVSLVGRGARAEIGAALMGERGDPGLLDLSSTWVGYTPFIAPRHIKKRRHTLEDQVRAELAERGFPSPTDIQVAGREELIASGFLSYVRQRRDATKRPPATRPWLLTLRFDSPVPGPIAIGYGCHYGLGVFRPLVDRSTGSARSLIGSA